MKRLFSFYNCRIGVANAFRAPEFHQPLLARALFLKIRTTSQTFCIYKNQMMAQRSITSFFTKTPKKPVGNGKASEVEAELSELEVKSDVDTTPENRAAVKKQATKRQRISSSGSETSPVKVTPPPSSNGKSKSKKRQRIESSSSEESRSPTECVLPVMSESPKKIRIKQEKDDQVKTYASPKNKKIKAEKGAPIEQNDNIVKRKSRSKSPPETKQVKTEEVVVKKEKYDDPKKEGKVSDTDYDPTKSNYHPIKDACWSSGQPVPYLALAKTLEAIEGISGRLKMIEVLSNYFRSVILLTPDDLLPSVYLCLNQLAPAYHSLELGIAETYLMKAIGQSTGRTLAQMRSAASSTGDLGLVAERARTTQRTLRTPPPLTVRKVLASLQEIARLTGQSSVNKKIGMIQTLYISCRQSEARYLIRSLAGKLRIGLAEQSVLQALAVATATTPPGQADIVDASKGVNPEEFKSRVESHALTIKTTYCECPNYERLVPAMLRHGVEALPRHCRLQAGVPLKPMLAHPARSLDDVFERFEGVEFTCEWKYDGERAQIHVPAGADGPDLTKSAIFSRNQEDNTGKYPDILRRLPALLGPEVKSCVLDCEAVAYDVDNKQILPFQVLSTRKRKEASESEIKVQVCVFVFDLLFLNGTPLVREPLSERRRLLREHFKEVPGEWERARGADCTAAEEVAAELEKAVKGSCEGLMLKALQGPRAAYDIARRSHNWLKLKKDYIEGCGDSIDCVVLGAYNGKGKRAGLYGGFLLFCWDPEQEQFQSLCKIGTGFSDEALRKFTDELKQHVIQAPKPYYRFDPSHSPDVWLEASCVWEVRCADISLSPAHRAACGHLEPDRGISLRFPRFVRVREDKAPEQATSARQLVEMYLGQDQIKNQVKTSATNHDEFY